jgi:hypothetical protein
MCRSASVLSMLTSIERRVARVRPAFLRGHRIASAAVSSQLEWFGAAAICLTYYQLHTTRC